MNLLADILKYRRYSLLFLPPHLVFSFLLFFSLSPCLFFLCIPKFVSSFHILLLAPAPISDCHSCQFAVRISSYIRSYICITMYSMYVVYVIIAECPYRLQVTKFSMSQAGYTLNDLSVRKTRQLD
uniref:Uncharacterized protein n=1 Tax=Cacopsylla melanoneura TaxID=428564 RepID=A0A8D8YGI6_9HEMI